MGTSLTSGALVLVAVMTDPRDLEIARLFGWYRIPLRTAPKVIAVDYLAFYQTPFKTKIFLRVSELLIIVKNILIRR